MIEEHANPTMCAGMTQSDRSAVGAEWAPQAEQVQPPITPLIDAINRSKVVVLLWRIAEGWPVEFVSENISQWGYTTEELYTGRVAWVDMVHPDDFLWLDTEVAGFYEKRLPSFCHTYRIFTKDGALRWIEDHTIACYDADGHITHYQGVIQDVTERIHAEQARTELEAQLRQTQRLEAIGRLAGGIAHDFNNLLTPIIGFTELALLQLPRDAGLQEHLRRVFDAAQRAAALTRQLLAFSRKQVLEVQVLDLTDAVRDCATMLRSLLGDDIELVFALDHQAGCIEADPTQLQQVLMNLAVNARDAMPGGGQLTIAVTQVNDGTNDAVRLTVRDTGCGMDAATQHCIFEPFFTTKSADKGTGLGLATVYGIVQQHQGRIHVESAVGIGSTFHVDFPHIAREASCSARKNVVPEVPGRGETILVAEDAEPVRKLVVQILQRHGYNVLAAAGGEEALRLASAHAGTIDLLVTDVVMPRMNGHELYTRLAVQNTPTAAVIYMSGYTENILSQNGVLSGMAYFLRKPFTMDALLYKVREALAATAHANRPGE